MVSYVSKQVPPAPAPASVSVQQKKNTPLMNTCDSYFTESTLQMNEAIFFIMFFIIMACYRQYWDYLKNHKRQVSIENMFWFFSTVMVMLWTPLWRVICKPARYGGFQKKTGQVKTGQGVATDAEKIYGRDCLFWAIVIGIGAFFLGYLVEVGGLNTLIYMETRAATTCTTNSEEYEAAVESWTDVTFIGLAYLVMFIFGISFIYLFQCHRGGFLPHYYEKSDADKSYTPTNPLYTFLSSLWTLLMYLVSIIINVIITVVFTIYSLLFNVCNSLINLITNNTIKNIQYFEIVKKFLQTPFAERFDPPINFFMSGRTISLLMSWFIELLVGAFIFAIPVILVIKNRLEFNASPVSWNHVLHEISTWKEVGALMLKFMSVLALKMMFEYYLWKSQHPGVSSIPKQSVKTQSSSVKTPQQFVSQYPNNE
jgi:hypothetical protein